MYEISSFADLFARQPLAEAATVFLPVWMIAFLAGLRAARPGPQAYRQGRFSRFHRLRKGEESLVFVTLLVWAGIATARSADFFEQLAYSHGPDSREFFVVAIGHLGAGAVTCCVIVSALSLRSRPASRLGLRGTSYFVSVIVLINVLLDAAFLLAVIAFYPRSSSGGIPLPMSLVS